MNSLKLSRFVGVSLVFATLTLTIFFVTHKIITVPKTFTYWDVCHFFTFAFLLGLGIIWMLFVISHNSESKSISKKTFALIVIMFLGIIVLSIIGIILMIQIELVNTPVLFLFVSLPIYPRKA